MPSAIIWLISEDIWASRATTATSKRKESWRPQNYIWWARCTQSDGKPHRSPVELSCYRAATKQSCFIFCQPFPIPPAGAIWNTHTVCKGNLPFMWVYMGSCCHRLTWQCVSVNFEQTNFEWVWLGHIRVHIKLFDSHLSLNGAYHHY